MAYGRSDIQHIKEAIEKLEDINDDVQDTKKDVHDFLEELREEMRQDGSSLLEDAYFSYSGSSYERTAVNPKTDFDISVVLSSPYGADNFTLIEAHEPGFYKLKSLERDEHEDRINQKGFLKVQELKEDIIDELIDTLKDIQHINANWTLRWKKNVNSIRVIMRVDGDPPINIDLVPVLRGRNLTNIPGICPRNVLPHPLAQRNNLEYHLTLGGAPYLKDKNDYHLLTTVAFTEMEKLCMKSSETVKNAVRFVKLTSLKKHWKRDYGLRAFHIKRIAIKYYDELHGLSNWDAYKSLLTHLSEELDDGVIDGFFLDEQNIYCKDEDDGETLASEIEEAARTIQPHHLKKLFTR